jgi:hypothetical protein
MGRKAKYILIPELNLEVDPKTAKFRDTHGNFVPLRDDRGHAVVYRKGVPFWADELVYRAVHGAHPNSLWDKRTGAVYQTLLIHKDRDPMNCAIYNLDRVPVEDDSTFTYLDSMIRERPHAPGTFRKPNRTKVYG